ncbi:MAG: hypothetical protein ACRDK7_05670 [Solirubrobacteraceae bacterium]
MSTTTQPKPASQMRRATGRSSRRERAARTQGHADAARARRERAHVRTAEHRRILDLLRRGAGVSQILRETRQPGENPADRLARANRLRRILEAPASTGDNTTPRLEPRKFTRTVAYLDYRIGLLQAEVEWAGQRRSDAVRTDSYGVQVQIRAGLPSFTIVGLPDGVQHTIGEELRKRLGRLWPSGRITVVTPQGWTPNDEALHALAHAIHVDHTH